MTDFQRLQILKKETAALRNRAREMELSVNRRGAGKYVPLGIQINEAVFHLNEAVSAFGQALEEEKKARVG
jgi:hypothetical protein